jgi:hypothetical protein
VLPYQKYIDAFKAIRANEKAKEIEIHAISDIPIEISQKSEFVFLKYKDFNGKICSIDYSADKNVNCFFI